MFGNSFHLGVKGEAWGMLQGYVGVPLEYRDYKVNGSVIVTESFFDPNLKQIFEKHEQQFCT